MHKSNTTRRKLYILCCLITRPLNGGRGGGAYPRGKEGHFSKISADRGGALIRRGAYSREAAHSRIQGILILTGLFSAEASVCRNQTSNSKVFPF